MTIETSHSPHSPHATPLFVCPLCFLGFLTLFHFSRHVRDRHPATTKPLHTTLGG